MGNKTSILLNNSRLKLSSQQVAEISSFEAMRERKKAFSQLMVAIFFLNFRRFLLTLTINFRKFWSVISESSTTKKASRPVEWVFDVLNLSEEFLNESWNQEESVNSGEGPSIAASFLNFIFLVTAAIGVIMMTSAIYILVQSMSCSSQTLFKAKQSTKSKKDPKTTDLYKADRLEVFGTPDERRRVDMNTMYISTPRTETTKQTNREEMQRKSPFGSLSDSKLFQSSVNFSTPLIGTPMFSTPKANGLNKSPLLSMNALKKNLFLIGENKNEEKEQENGLTKTQKEDEEAYTLLENLKVDWLDGIGSSSTTVDRLIDDWTEKLRNFLRDFIMNDILIKFQKNCVEILQLLVNNELNAFGRGKKKLISILSFEFEEEDDEIHENELEKLLQQYQIVVLSTNRFESEFQQLKRLIQARKRLERFFRVVRRGGDPSRTKSYVLHRLESLVNGGSTMPHFNWSGGQPHNGRSYSVALFPTDAEILLNIAGVWLETALKKNPNSFLGSQLDVGVDHKQRSFHQLHVRDELVTDEKSLKKQGFWGVLVSTPRMNPEKTHYKLVVEGTLWQVRSGRLNVFHTILLLLYSMKAKGAVGAETFEHLVGGKKKSTSHRFLS